MKMVNKNRDKESDRESSDGKKHRKANFSNSKEIPAKLSKNDVYAVRMFMHYFLCHDKLNITYAFVYYANEMTIQC